jgi:hypothetical protein
MNSYEERQEARRERYLERAEKARAESSEGWRQVREMSDAIPFGQPIHVGHHSEKGDRAYRARIEKTSEKAFRLNEKADYYEQKAASVGTGGISSDDPEAIEKLKKDAERLKVKQERMKAANRAIRMKDTAKGDAKLKEMGYTTEDIEALRTPKYGRIGFPAWQISNNGANIRRIEGRIKELEERATREPEHIVTDLYELKVEDNRVQFIFDGKPDEEVRNILKYHAFKWSPSRGAWVRQASGNGLFAARQAKRKLDELNAKEKAPEAAATALSAEE